MAVRVRIKIHTASGKSIETIALANAGAETEVPILAIPLNIAKDLNLWPTARDISVVVRELSSETLGYLPPVKVFVDLLDESGNKLSEASSYILVKPGLDESTLSDALIEELGIIILMAKRGLWKHINDPEGTVRSSIR